MKRRKRSTNGCSVFVVLLVLAVVAWCGVLWSLTGVDAAKVLKVVVSTRGITDASQAVTEAFVRITHFQFGGPTVLNQIVLVPVALILVVAFALFMAGARKR
jgi:hypothetical protein